MVQSIFNVGQIVSALDAQLNQLNRLIKKREREIVKATEEIRESQESISSIVLKLKEGSKLSLKSQETTHSSAKDPDNTSIEYNNCQQQIKDLTNFVIIKSNENRKTTSTNSWKISWKREQL